MSTTTEQTKTAGPGQQSQNIPTKPSPPPPRILTLQHFLDQAYAAEKANLEPSNPVMGGFTIGTTNAAMTIVMLGTDGHHYAGINDTVMHYSGSLVKVAALYAAFDLRAEARQHASTQTFSDTASFLSSLSSAVNPTGAIARLRTLGIGLQPVLKDILVGFRSSGTDKVDFQPTYRSRLVDIFTNAGARGVIRPLGYSYINVSLIRSRFFDPDPAKLNGIWLAGDYSGDLPAPQRLKVSRVPVANDTVPGGGAQAMTTKEMSRMFQVIHLRQGYTHITDAAEQGNATFGVHAILQTQLSFFFDTQTDRLMHLTVAPAFNNADSTAPNGRHCSKVGIGSLGEIRPQGGTTGPSVYSEGAVMAWNTTSEVTAFNSAKTRNLSGEFVLVWQNMYDQASRWDALVRVVNTTIKGFLTQP